MKIVFLLIGLFFLKSGIAQTDQDIPPLVVDDTTISVFKDSSDIIENMNKMEEVRLQLLQKILEAIDGKEDDTSEHTEALKKAPNFKLTTQEFSKDEFNEFSEVEAFFKYSPDKFWPDTGSSRDFTTLKKAKEAIESDFFIGECETFSEAGRNKKFLNRQNYLAKLSVYALDFSDQIYSKVIDNLESYKSVRIGGMCLKEDVIVNFDVYKVIAQKLITDISLKLMSMEMQALNSLIMLPIQLSSEPLYRQKEVKRLLQLVDPKYDFEAEIRNKRCQQQKKL